MMKSRLFTCFVIAFWCMVAVGADKAIKFKAVNNQGYTLKYAVLSEAQHTVELTDGPREDILIIPQFVIYNNETYTVTRIGDKALSPGNANFKRGNVEVVLPASITEIGYKAFAANRKLKRINIPSGIKRIEGYAFWCCDGLLEIDLPEGLIEIGRHAFLDAGLKSLKIPNSIKIVGELAFSKWGGIARDFYLENIPNIITTANCEEMGISRSSVEAYLAEHPRNFQHQQDAQEMLSQDNEEREWQEEEEAQRRGAAAAAFGMKLGQALGQSIAGPALSGNQGTTSRTPQMNKTRKGGLNIDNSSVGGVKAKDLPHVSDDASSSTSTGKGGGTRKCRVCDGTGQEYHEQYMGSAVAGKKKYCDVCKKDVVMGHTHRRCETCKGKGYL